MHFASGTAGMDQRFAFLALIVGPPKASLDLKQLSGAFDRNSPASLVATLLPKFKLEGCAVRFGVYRKGGVERANAWLMTTGPVPVLGTKEFKRHQFTIGMWRAYIEVATLEEVVFAISHELSHVLLHGLQYQEHDEKLVDLMAMYLGCSEIYPNARAKTIGIGEFFRTTPSPRHLFAFVKARGSQAAPGGYLSNEEILESMRRIRTMQRGK